jgi:hypothetical protein
MGKTAFSGPVYGAKCGLMSFCYAAGAISSGASTAVLPAGQFITPSYSIWMPTELFVNVSTCSSNNYQFKVKYESPSYGTTLDGRNVSSQSGTLFTVGSGTSTSINTSSTCATTAGEYEGFVLTPGSTVRIVSSGNSAPGVVQLNLHGYIRYIEAANRTV